MISSIPRTGKQDFCTHVVEPNRRHLHEPERHHPKPHLQPDPALRARARPCEAEHEEPARRDAQRREHQGQPVLRLGEALPPVLRLALEPRVGDGVRVGGAEHGADEGADVDEADVGAPAVRRHGEDLRRDGRDGDDAADQPAVVRHDHPRAGQPQRAPRLQEAAHHAAGRPDEAEGAGEGVGTVVMLGRCGVHVLLVSYRVLGWVFQQVDIRGCTVSGVQGFGGEEQVAEEGSAGQGQADPVGVCPAVLVREVSPGDTAHEGAGAEENGVDGLRGQSQNSSRGYLRSISC